MYNFILLLIGVRVTFEREIFTENIRILQYVATYISISYLIRLLCKLYIILSKNYIF